MRRKETQHRQVALARSKLLLSVAVCLGLLQCVHGGESTASPACAPQPVLRTAYDYAYSASFDADDQQDRLAPDYGCASDGQDAEQSTSVAGSAVTSSENLVPKFVDVLNNCTSEFPPNSSAIFVNGVSLLLLNLCSAPNSDGQNGSANSSDAYRTTLAFPLWITVVVAFLSLLISVVTVVGNVIVLLSFVIERTLRQATNYFIASLAVSDLLIGLFSMNLYTLYIILDEEWVLGKVVCNLWLSLDYTVCLASQYTVFFITVDRFCSVKMPAKYRNWRTDNKVFAMVLFSWILPSLVFFVSIMGWDFFTDAAPPNPLVKTTCIAGFQNDPLFNFLLTVFYYW